MDSFAKEQWVKALRSGDFLQGKGALAKFEGADIRYCCLGVLSEVAFRNGIGDKQIRSGDDCISYDGGKSYPSQNVQSWASIDMDPLVAIPNDDRKVCLSDCNDAFGMSFKQIADLIEEQL
jgi:hypothetical protein